MYLASTVGSHQALSHMTGTLVVAWLYRMLERFCVDGLPGMDRINRCLSDHYKDMGTPKTRSRAPTLYCGASGRAQRVVLRAAAAVISPTAVLHWLTGVSLLAGYAHARSLEIA